LFRHQLVLFAASSITRGEARLHIPAFSSVIMKTRSRSSSSAKAAKKAVETKPSKKSKSIASHVDHGAKNSKKERNATCNEHSPWYKKFTKGDEEYDTYMATEWGFEKVRSIYCIVMYYILLQ
jgi:hypothetical protein